MSAVVIAAAIALVVAIPVLLVALSGGPVVVFAEHDLPRPNRSARAPKEG